MKEKLNVIFLGSFLYPYGFAATKRKQQFLDYIISKRDKARVLITLKWARGNEINANYGIFKGIQYEVLGKNVRKNISFFITFPIFIFNSLKKLATYKSKSSKNIIVAFGINFDTILPLLFAYFYGYKIVFDIVEDFPSINKNYKGIKERIKYFFLIDIQRLLKFKIASAISVISLRIYKTHTKYLKNDTQIILIPISADNLFLTIENSKNKKAFCFLYAGTYGEKDGLSFLFEAFKQFIKTVPDAKLILTGNCPDELKKEIRIKYKIYANAEITGRLDDEDYYHTLQKADVLLMTRNNSLFANTGFPYKLGEYLATGNPVIATKVSDVEYYLKNMESAVIVEPENYNSILEAMIFLYKEKGKAKEIGKKGREVCSKYFNPKVNSQSFYNLLKSC